MEIGELKHGNIKDQNEQGMMKNTLEDKVKFVVCAGGEARREEPLNMLVWTSMDSSGGGSPEIDRCRKCLRSLAASWSRGDVQVLDP